MRDYREFKTGSLTEMSSNMWEHLKLRYRIERLESLALMFEARLSELDPSYKAYPFGRIYGSDSKVPESNSNAMQMIALEPT